MDVEEEKLSGSNDDHDGTEELNIDWAGMLIFSVCFWHDWRG